MSARRYVVEISASEFAAYRWYAACEVVERARLARALRLSARHLVALKQGVARPRLPRAPAGHMYLQAPARRRVKSGAA